MQAHQPGSEPAVLLVEDDANDEDLTCRALRSGGVQSEVQVIRDGKDALDHLHHVAARGWPLPGLVLLDLNLPGVSGFSLLQAMRERACWRRVPVVVFSTSQEPLDVSRCYDLGCNSFVQKPVDFNRFREVIASVGHYWLTVNISSTGDEVHS